MPVTSPLARRVALALLLIGITACDLSSSPSTSAAPGSSRDVCGPDEVAGGGLVGSVVDAGGEPLNDIFIVIETSDGFRGTTRTGEDGLFTAPGVAGEFRITTTDIDYAELVRQVTVPCGELVEVELVLTRVGS